MRIPSSEIPQADLLQDVVRVVTAVHEGARTFQDIANYIGKVGRQGRYYRLAAEILGLICDVSGKFGQMSAFLKLQIICNNLKLGGMHDNQEKVPSFA